ncbi:unnamed protein product [Linum tenue]|uniref:Uncharacterized protein n=1 Tax=Linum tenue TaxID=586396 RepID=A0AAV0PRA9_9ROSI|nr:unnamed protein product [Linum tenue]
MNSHHRLRRSTVMANPNPPLPPTARNKNIARNGNTIIICRRRGRNRKRARR